MNALIVASGPTLTESDLFLARGKYDLTIVINTSYQICPWVLGLAKHMGAKKVLLVGVDATNEERCEGGYCRDLSHLPLLIASAKGQGVEFAPIAKLHPCIPNFTIEEGLEWLRS